MAVTMAGLEIEKTSGYWRAKGFKQPGVLERLEREDGVIIHQRREWACTIRKQVSSRRRPERSGVC